MSRYFKDLEKKEEEPEEDEPIEEYEMLVEAFNSLLERYQNHIDRGTEFIYEIHEDIMGDEHEEGGLLNYMEELLKDNYGLAVTNFGRKVDEMVKAVKRYMNYSKLDKQHLLKFVKERGFEYQMKCSFKIIESLYGDIERLKLQNQKLIDEKREMMERKQREEHEKNGVESKNSSQREHRPADLPLNEGEKDAFWDMFVARWLRYEDAVMKGDQKLMALRKGNMFTIAGRSEEKKKLIRLWFKQKAEELDRKLEERAEQPAHFEQKQEESRKIPNTNQILTDRPKQTGDYGEKVEQKDPQA